MDDPGRRTMRMNAAERVDVQCGEDSAVFAGVGVLSRWAAATDRGLARPVNQDSVGVGDLMYAVCDGMGGHLGGETASRIAVDALVDLPTADVRCPADVSASFSRAQQVMESTTSSRPDLAGMGSTGTVVAVCQSEDGPVAIVANVGDTRAFAVDALGFRQITVDHTIVQELLTTGEIDPGDVEAHPERHVLTRAIGGVEPVAVDVRVLQLRGQTRFVLTSDGVHGFVPAARLATLATIGDPESVVARVMAAGLEEGAPDNLTCLVADLTPIPNAETDDRLDERTVPRVGLTTDQVDHRSALGPEAAARLGE